MSFKKFTVAVLFAVLSLGSAQTTGGFLTSSIQCTPESRQGEICSMIADPVCGYRPDVVCAAIPCKYETYANACEACHDPQVVSYTIGPCAPTN